MRNINIFFKSIAAFLKLGTTLLLSSKNPQKLQKAGKDFRKYFESLGGIFVKFGQILSLRVDIFPEEICSELRNLFDSVPPFDYSTAQEIFLSDFGKSIEDTFSTFNKQPIASASLGQVYKAKLKNGDWVAVKVRRPNIETLVHNDSNLITLIGKIVDFIPFIPIRIKPVIEEFSGWIIEELDYHNEARNLKEFYSYKSAILPIFNIPLQINLPKVYDQYSSEQVLTMEFIDGITINKIISLKKQNDKNQMQKLEKKGYNLKKILKNINLLQLKQLFIDGYFNADPHPANLIIKPNNEVYFVDFGLVGKLSDRQKTALSRFLRSSSVLDWKSAFEAALIIFNLNDPKKKQKLEVAIKEMFDYLKAERKKVNSYSKASTDSLLYFSKLIYKLRIPLPVDVSKAMRCVMTSDGIVHNLAPDASVEEITQDQFRVALAATYLGIKRQLTPENLKRLIIKVINYIEREVLLEE